MPADLTAAYAAALDEVLRCSHLMAPDQIGQLAAAGAAHLGATTTVIWLVDYEQAVLVPMLPMTEEPREPLSVDGSVAGRAFRVVEPVESELGDDRRVWVPLLDGV